MRSDKFGVTMKDDVAARIEDVSSFLNWSLWPFLTPRSRSSVFHRVGYHGKVWTYFTFGILCFIAELNILRYYGHAHVKFSTYVDEVHVSIAMRLLSFILSAYIIIIVKTYHQKVRSKARNMMYGCSNAVDTLSVCLDYDHPTAGVALVELHSAMTAIGQYALAQASKKCAYKLSSSEMEKLFYNKGLDASYLTQLPPKQCLHVLRLAILQTVALEKENGCLTSMTKSDWKTFRRDLNDYCGGASQTTSALSSSKLPYSYIQLVNWATHAIMLYVIGTSFMLYARQWHEANICLPWADKCFQDKEATEVAENAIFWMDFCVNNLFELIMLYFVFGCLEIYESTTRNWESGLVLKNYNGIVELICEPLVNSMSRPMSVQQLLHKTVDDGGVEETKHNRRGTWVTHKIFKSFTNRSDNNV